SRAHQLDDGPRQARRPLRARPWRGIRGDPRRYGFARQWLVARPRARLAKAHRGESPDRPPERSRSSSLARRHARRTKSAEGLRRPKRKESPMSRHFTILASFFPVLALLACD